MVVLLKDIILAPIMELLLTFQNLGTAHIPYNYQYYISSWIYSVLAKGDASYAQFLHDSGYQVAADKHRNFKHFCFSRLWMENYEPTKEGLIIKGPNLQLSIRFHIDEALKTFVMGLFKEEILKIKNGIDSHAIFLTQSVEMKEVKVVDSPAHIRMLTPLVIGKKQDNGNDLYLEPYHEGFKTLFMYNLIDKVKSSHLEWNDAWKPEEWDISVLTPRDKVKSNKITIKQDTNPIDIRGYLFDFELRAPLEVIKVGLESGFGKHGSLGFGFGGGELRSQRGTSSA